MINSRFNYGGEIRYEILHGDGSVENVLINNLMAARNRFCTDVCGNRFPAYWYLPPKYWKILETTLLKEHGLRLKTLRTNKDDGVLGLVDDCILYKRRHGTHIILYSPHNDCYWFLKVTQRHELIRKTRCFELVGKNKGFDMIIPMHPMLGYAPLHILLEWKEEGYTSAISTLESIKLMEPKQKMQLVSNWEGRGYHSSKQLLIENGLAKLEDFKVLSGGMNEQNTYQRALPEPSNDKSSSSITEGEYREYDD